MEEIKEKDQEKEKNQEKIKVFLQGIAMDPVSNSPILLLKEENGERILPIWIGVLEATSIAAKLENIKFPRPLTHDLMKNIFDELKIEVPKIEITDLRDNTYYALITLRVGDRELQIDARPSDAIALALRTNAEIFVNKEVFEKSQVITMPKEEKPEVVPPAAGKEDKEKLKELLEKLDPKQFKYKM